MAISNSLIQTQWVRDSFKGAILPKIGAASGPDALFCALFLSTTAVSQDTDPATYGVAPYTSGSEVTGTNWLAGGVALTSPTCTLVAGVGVQIGAGNVSVASTTLSNVFASLIYDNTLSPKAALILVDFGQNYATTNGTFGITWSGSGIAQIQLHP
jgi:hypothetical protein